MAALRDHCLSVLGLLALLSTVHAQQIIITESPPSFQCVNITSISICSQININYTMGSFPNWRDQTQLSKADQELNTYLPVIKTGCSETIVHLLCTVYAPFCQPDLPHIRLPPCKEICLAAREGCEPVFQRFNHQWPPVLDCDRYPSREETRLSFCYTDDISEIMIPPNIMVDSTAGCTASKINISYLQTSFLVLDYYSSISDPPSAIDNLTWTAETDSPGYSTVTVTWDHTPQQNVPVSYVVSIYPTPISGIPVTTDTTVILIVVSYNTSYNVTIRAQNCAGVSNALVVIITDTGKCF